MNKNKLLGYVAMAMLSAASATSIAFAEPVTGEAQPGSLGDAINSAERNKQQKEQQAATAQSALMYSPPPVKRVSVPKLVAVRGMGAKLTATFETESGTIDVVPDNPDIGNGWKLVFIRGSKAKITHPKEGNETVFLTGRAGSSEESSSSAMPPAPPGYSMAGYPTTR